jgi:nicotinamidase-related amidase
MKALLVVDVQTQFGWPNEISAITNDKLRAIANNINLEIDKAREVGTPVIFAIYGADYDHTDAYQLTAPCIACSNENIGLAQFIAHRHFGEFIEPVFFKMHNNSFTNPNLENYLKLHGIDNISLIGCNTYACLLETAQGAMRAGFDVTLLANCARDQITGVINSQAEGEDWIAQVKKPLKDENAYQGNVEVVGIK